MKLNYNLCYAGVDIPFIADLESGNPTMINATKMLQCFPNKRMSDFLSNQSTKNYINSLSYETGIPASQLIVSRKGNSSNFEQGTWMHEDLAIEFARWLNPEFGVWCNRKIKELLINGVTTLKNEIIQLRQVNDQLQQDISRLQQDNSQLQQTYNQMLPYANYSYSILKMSDKTYCTTDVVKGFSCKISPREVFTRLVDNNIIGRYANSPYWFLKAPYDKMGFTRLVSKISYDSNGQVIGTSNRTRWTEDGRMFLGSILSSWGVIQNPISANP